MTLARWTNLKIIGDMTPLNVILSLLVLACTAGSGAETAPANAYSYATFLNGHRRTKADSRPTLFALDTSRYSFSLDLNDFARAGFALKPHSRPGYLEALAVGTKRLHRLPPAELVIEMEEGGKVFRAANCAAGRQLDNAQVRLWESGRYVQHYDFLDLQFFDEHGTRLDCTGSLDLVAWPGSLTFTATLAPDDNDCDGPSRSVWNDAKLRVRLKAPGIACQQEKTIAGPWTAGETKALTLTYSVAAPEAPGASLTVTVSTPTLPVVPVEFEPTKQCFVATVAKGILKRSSATGTADHHAYDELVVTVENPGKVAQSVPFLLDLRDTANITGLCPVLCDREGRPTGIPVQLSKNWHYRPMGAYLMAYTCLPAKPGRTEYRLRVVYGFYGQLPSASHAQLSLVGYGGHGRWDQLAIGCWGETMCFDMDMSLVDVAVTDVRLLMVRDGLKGGLWGWTTAGWGGDWLGLTNASGEKVPFGDLQTAYVSQGPCLTDVRYRGFYGADREVAVTARVQTLRTDDYSRVFQKLHYTFNAATPTKGMWLFKMGRSNGLVTPRVAYGNAQGLIAEQAVPATITPSEKLVDQVTLTGEAPWWVSFPGSFSTGPIKPNGYRALVIRAYRATAGGKISTEPTISLPVHRVHSAGLGVDIDLLLVPPAAVNAWQPGDEVEMDLEWITLPRVADDYYGPNEAFRQHLAAHPASWETTYREAIGNDLNVVVRGGKLRERYPLVIHARSQRVEVHIRGGVGCVPIRFEGLATATGYELYELVDGVPHRLDQSVHGNDFWQTDYDAETQTYALTYNLPLDNKPQSVWVLQKSGPHLLEKLSGYLAIPD